MTGIYTGGLAFPAADSDGLTKRDFFAALALVGLLSNCADKTFSSQLIAASWTISDKMLAARDKEPEV